MDRLNSPTITRTICVRCSLFILTSFERILLRAQQRLTQRIHELAHKKAKNKVCNAAADPSRADTQTTVNWRERAFSQVTRLLVMTRFIVNYPIGSPVSGLPTIRSELTAASTADQVHACQMMTEVHTVSIIAKNKYSGRAGVRAPKRGGTKVRKPFTRVKIEPAMIFASRFALNASSRDATIMAMGISIKTAEPIKAHGGRCGASASFGEPTIANSATTSAYR